jgi:iron(III) transport system permease protein
VAAGPVRGPGKQGAVARPPLGLLLLAAGICCVGAAPVVYLLAQAIGGGGGEAASMLLSARIAGLAAASLALAAVVVIGSLMVAVPLAWLTALTDIPFPRALTALAVAPLAVPCYVGASALIASTSTGGALHWMSQTFLGTAPPVARGFWAGALVLILFIYPLALLPIRAAMLRIDRAQIEAARSLGRGRMRTALTVGLSQIAPALGAGALLVGLYALAEFGAVSLLRCRTFTSVIYIQYQTFNKAGAAVSAAALVLLIITILALYELLPRRRGSAHRSGRPLRVALGRWRWPAMLLPLAVAGISVGGVIISLGQWLAQQPEALSGAGGAGVPWRAAGASLAIGAAAAAAAIVVAGPIALLAARHRTRLVGALERLSFVGFGLPGIVIALGLGSLALRHAALLYQTWALVILAMVILFLPQAVGAIRTPLEQAPGRLEEAARSLGRSRAGAFFEHHRADCAAGAGGGWPSGFHQRGEGIAGDTAAGAGRLAYAGDGSLASHLRSHVRPRRSPGPAPDRAVGGDGVAGDAAPGGGAMMAGWTARADVAPSRAVRRRSFTQVCASWR